MVDLDGSADYGPVRSVALSSDFAEVLVYPNPVGAQTTVRFTFPDDAVHHLRLTNGAGRLVTERTVRRSGRVELQGLPPGVYLWTGTGGEAFYAGRLIVR